MSQTHVHNTAVDVAELLEAKQPSAVSRVIEGVGLLLGLLLAREQSWGGCGGEWRARKMVALNSDGMDAP